MCHCKIRNTEKKLSGSTNNSFDIEDICSFYEGYKAKTKDLQFPFEMFTLHSAITRRYTLEDLCQYGKHNTICPYYLARESLAAADIIVFNYQALHLVLRHA